MTTAPDASSASDPAAVAAALAELLRRVAARDAAAFATLYRETQSKLYGVVARILTRGDRSGEALQEAYVRIWEKAGDFDPSKGSPIAWMATIARNRALDEVRRVRPSSLEDMPEGFEPAADAIDPNGSQRCSIVSRGSRRNGVRLSCSPITEASAERRWRAVSTNPCRRSKPGCAAAFSN
jgi:RNA polymerase sigma factor (sigma-70 family)